MLEKVKEIYASFDSLTPHYVWWLRILLTIGFFKSHVKKKLINKLQTINFNMPTKALTK